MSASNENDAVAAQLRAALALLDEIHRDRRVLDALPREERQRFLALAGQVSDPSRKESRKALKERRRAEKAERVKREEEALNTTGIRELRRRPVFTTPNYLPPPEAADATSGTSGTLGTFGPEGSQRSQRSQGFQEFDYERDSRPADHRICYVCKQPYVEIHQFYDQLCPSCAELNLRKRTELADLRGRVALLTGGRVKIGYQAGLKLLRCGAHLIVTTRFPRDSAARYAQEPDFDQWKDRLEIFGLDLRHTPSVEAFCAQLLATHDRLDFIINNACQTVRRPPGFYQHMMDRERAALDTLSRSEQRLLGKYEGLRAYQVLPEAEGGALAQRGVNAVTGLTHAAELSQVALVDEDHLAGHDLFPEGQLDQDLQQIDLRDSNSWRLLLAEVSTVELLEVQLVNAVAPFIINARLKPLMTRTPERDKHVVNVSAMEGQFYRYNKTTRHPHTNMAKAALNMMTRTSAADYFNDGIHMNSVDTGWVTDEDPVAIAARKTADHRFHPPLDIVDGAARIVDPIIDGFNTGVHVWGKFLKDYRETPW